MIIDKKIDRILKAELEKLKIPEPKPEPIQEIIAEIPKELSEPKIAEIVKIKDVKSEKEEIQIFEPPKWNLSDEEIEEQRKWVIENIRELDFWNEIFKYKKEIIEKELVALMLKNQNLELNPKNTTLMLSRIFKSEHKRILLKDNNYKRNYFRNFQLC